MSFMMSWLPFEMFQRRLTKEEKKEIEEKRISILPKTGIKQHNELHENMHDNLKKTHEINNKSEKLHDSAKSFYETAKNLSKKK